MTDIVERLRIQGKDAFHRHYSLGMYGLCAQAADEIEDLRSSLLSWKNSTNEAKLREAYIRESAHVDTIKACEAEIERLRSAVEDSIIFMTEMRDRHGDSGVGILIKAARAALNPTESKK